MAGGTMAVTGWGFIAQSLLRLLRSYSNGQTLSSCRRCMVSLSGRSLNFVNLNNFKNSVMPILKASRKERTHRRRSHICIVIDQLYASKDTINASSLRLS